MAVTDQQKLDFLLKKIGYTKTKTGSVVGTGAISGTPKQPFAEAIPSPLIIANSALWNESGSIPTTPPGSDTTQVKVYLAASSGLRMTADSTSSGQRAYIAYSTYNNTSSTRLTNWIDTQFGSAYLIKVFRGDPNSGGVALSAAGSGNNDGWFFDYSAGVLNFNDTNVPSGVTDTNVYIVGYRYIGSTGAPTPTGGGNFTFHDLNVTGDLDVDGHTNLDNVSIAGVTTHSGSTTFDQNITFNGSSNGANWIKSGDKFRLNDNSKVNFGSGDNMQVYHTGSAGYITNNTGAINIGGNVNIEDDLDVDGHTNLDNVSIAGVVTATTFVGALTGNVTGNASGNAGTATALQTARNIGGVSFDGTSDIDLPGVNIAGNQDTSGTAAGLSGSPSINITNLTAVDGTFSGNVSIGGTLTYEDVTNIDSVGLVTARSGIFLPDSQKAQFGNVAGSADLEIYHDGNHSYIHDGGTGNLKVRSNNFRVSNGDESKLYATFTPTAVELYYNNIKRLETTGIGIAVNGKTDTTLLDVNERANIYDMEVSGISTFLGGVDVNSDLDVDGHTNLDNVSISGMTTTQNIQLSSNLILFDHAGGIQGNQKIWNDGSDFRMYSTSTTGIRIQANAAGGTSSDLKLQTDTIDALVVKGTGEIEIAKDLDVDGHTNLDNVSIAGVSTFSGNILPNTDSSHDIGTNTVRFANIYADTLHGDGSQLTGISVDATSLKDPNGNIKIQAQASGAVHTGISTFQDIDVDGHTNLDNVSIAGVTTITSNVLYLKSASGSGPTISAITGSDVLNLASNGLIVKNQNGWKGLEFTGSSIELYSGQMASHKLVLQTNSSGVALPLDLDVDGHTNLDNVSIAGITTTSGGVDFNDNVKARFGTNNNLEIYHNPVNSYIANNSNNLFITNADGDIFIQAKAGENSIICNNNGSVQLYHDDSLKCQTRDFGFSIFQDLDVDGHTNLDNVSVAGVTTFTGNARFDSTITAGGGTGNNGQYLKSTGSGVAWESFPTMRTTTTVTASAGQTTFSFTYNVGFLDVFINGTKLTDSEFTATNGSSVVLAVGCFIGDIVDLISYNTVSGGGGGGGGSITVQDEGSSLSTGAETLNFVGTGVVASGTGATKTITINTGTASTAEIRANTLQVGFTTFTRAVLMKENQRINFRDANTAIYHQTNFNIESSGSGGDIILKTNASGGDSKDIVLHGGNVSGELLRAHGTGDVDITNTLGIGGSITKASGHLDIRASNLSLKNANNSATYASFTDGGAAELNYNNTKRLETTSGGVNVIGSLFVNGSAIGGGGGGSSLFSQTVAGIHTLSNVGIGTADPEFDLDLGSFISSGVSVASTIRIIGENNSTAIRIGPGGASSDITLIRVDSGDGTTDGDYYTDLGHSIKYMGSGSGVENRLAFWVDNTNKTKYEALSIYNNGYIGINYNLGFNGVPPTDHFTVENGTSKFECMRVVGVSTFQNVLPQTDSTYDIGTNTVRFRNIYADNLYGDGTNITGISGGGGTDVGITTNLSGSFSATPGSPSTINTFSGYSSDDLVVEYTIYIKNGSNIQTQKLLAMRDGTTIDSTQFAVMFSSSLLAQFDATISSGNILLRATPESGITGTIDYKIKREVM